jgi:hypothetical protein
MDRLTELWHRLSAVQTLRFTSESATGIGWQGRGSGIVTVHLIEPHILHFEELGYWRQDGGEEIRFTNIFRWTRLKDRVRLEHLRFGVEHPVFLFEMTPDENGIWRDLCPHACKLDRYSVSLRLESSWLDVRWVAQGPTRDEKMNYIYI